MNKNSGKDSQRWPARRLRQTPVLQRPQNQAKAMSGWDVVLVMEVLSFFQFAAGLAVSDLQLPTDK